MVLNGKKHSCDYQPPVPVSPTSFKELDEKTSKVVTLLSDPGTELKDILLRVKPDGDPLPYSTLVSAGLNVVRANPDLRKDHEDACKQDLIPTDDGGLIIGYAAAKAALVGLEIIFDRAEEQSPVPEHTEEAGFVLTVLTHLTSELARQAE